MWMSDLGRVVVVGIGATIVLDLWLNLLKRLGVPTLNFAFIGRWVGHVFRGEFMQPAIAKATSVRGELALGWLTHYAIGILFASLLSIAQGRAWLQNPSLLPALVVGICTSSRHAACDGGRLLRIEDAHPCKELHAQHRESHGLRRWIVPGCDCRQPSCQTSAMKMSALIYRNAYGHIVG
jgi:hypothetical protein